MKNYYHNDSSQYGLGSWPIEDSHFYICPYKPVKCNETQIEKGMQEHRQKCLPGEDSGDKIFATTNVNEGGQYQQTTTLMATMVDPQDADVSSQLRQCLNDSAQRDIIMGGALKRLKDQQYQDLEDCESGQEDDDDKEEEDQDYDNESSDQRKGAGRVDF